MMRGNRNWLEGWSGFWIGVAIAALIVATSTGSHASTPANITNTVGVCDPNFPQRCIAPAADGSISATIGAITAITSITDPVGVKGADGATILSTSNPFPISDAGSSLTIDTLQLPSSLGVKTSAASLSIAPASDAVFPVSQSGTWTVQPGNTANTTPWLVTATGNVASGATDSGNPVKIGGISLTTTPTFTDGQRGDLQIGTRGSLRVEIIANNGTTGVSAASGGSDTVSNTNGGLIVYSRGNLFNGTTYDRSRSIIDGTNSVGTGITAVGITAQVDDTGPATITENQFGNLRMSTNRALLTKPYATASQDWTYAAASGGITNSTTAITMVSGAASVRNYVTSCQISSDALGAATELAIRDGAGGTVLIRVKVGTAGLSPTNIEFPIPLKSSVNTLLEIVTLTATITGGIYPNCQGYTAP